MNSSLLAVKSSIYGKKGPIFFFFFFGLVDFFHFVMILNSIPYIYLPLLNDVFPFILFAIILGQIPYSCEKFCLPGMHPVLHWSIYVFYTN